MEELSNAREFARAAAKLLTLERYLALRAHLSGLAALTVSYPPFTGDFVRYVWFKGPDPPFSL
jgi:hypothetical protein